MGTEIVVALIASGTSVVVALVTLLVTLNSTRNSARSAKELERLRFELAQAAANKALLDQHTDEVLAGLQAAIQSIQELKDEMQLAAAGMDKGVGLFINFERINATRDRMFKHYERYLTALEEPEAKLFHDAKTLSVGITGWAYLASSSVSKGDSAEVLPLAKSQLEKHRKSLSDIQQRLRDRRAEVIMKKLGIAPPAPPETTTEVGAGGPAEALPPAALTVEGLKVLLVDDGPEFREMMSLALGRRGAEVNACESVAQALEEMKRGRFDVLLADISLPGQDGYELIRQVRALKPEDGGHIPAIACTGFGSEEDRQRALAAGFNRHVPKPADPEEVVAAVAALADRTAAPD